MKFYKQCRLQVRDGAECTTGWIEVRGARVGATVELKPDGTLWEVLDVADVPMLREDQLKEHQQLNRHSLPSIAAIH